MSVYEISEIVVNENNEPLVLADGNILCHVVNSSGERDTIGVTPEIVNSIFNVGSPPQSEVDEDKKDEWNTEQSKYVLDKYFEYLSEVGPMKRFKMKKHMWIQIAKEISEKFKKNRNANQVENRYKTIMKRKKKAVTNNQTSGARREKVGFEEELKKISSIDDSLEPEVLQDQVTLEKKEHVKAVGIKRKQNETVIEYLKKINAEKKAQRERHHLEREQNKERRHKEKLDVLKELFNT